MWPTAEQTHPEMLKAKYPHALWRPRGWDGAGAGRGVEEGAQTCIPVGDSCWDMAETSTVLQSNYPPIKNTLKLKKKKKIFPQMLPTRYRILCRLDWCASDGHITNRKLFKVVSVYSLIWSLEVRECNSLIRGPQDCKLRSWFWDRAVFIHASF